MDIFTRELLAGALVSAFLLGIAPYCFPHSGSRDGLPTSVTMLIARYVWGAGSLLLGFAVWLALIDQALLILGLVGITVAGGGVVVFRYASDWLRRVLDQHRMMRESDRELASRE